MSILKLFFNHLLDEVPKRDDNPLSHPVLEAMSLEELADLPLMPENLGRQTEKREACPNECA